jgi:meiotically up-regulated gene 157 (Mug157) protein
MESILIILLCLITLSGSRPLKPSFVSTEVNKYIAKMKPLFKDQELAKIFENTFPNTLDTTVEYDPKTGDTFIITGDIEAMWLRDSSFQIYPYLKFAKTDNALKTMILGLIRKQSDYVAIDPYANAFKRLDKHSDWADDITYKMVNGTRVPAMNDYLWERKYELDSTVSTLWLAYNFYEATGDTSFITADWINSLQVIIKMVGQQTQSTDEDVLNGGPQYFFQRKAYEPMDTLHQGVGNPGASCSLVRSAFRSSDDASLLPYNIAENAFLSTTFAKVAKMLAAASKGIRVSLIEQLQAISKQIETNIYKYGVFVDPITQEKYFAYEIDCYGNHYFMDDPGYPSLTSLPFFGFLDTNNEIYINTRKRILDSHKNPYYFKGKIGEGLGSPHSERGFIWPLYTIMRALTSNDEKEIAECITQLQITAEKTGFIHESVNVDDVKKYTRSWFAWANGFFGHLINTVIEKYPNLILNMYK